MKLTEHDAVNIVSAALQSGSIQLNGNAASTSDDAAKNRGTRDATYLKSLVETLITEQSPQQ